jgi:bifunctional non-homologous end joining protein LigD
VALEEYNRKRDFKKTQEPPGQVKGTPGGDLFVIQKHAASRLHYDFRLELDGVLLSWSVPKGPSLDPAQKRLAVHVEDHPLDYAMFEGLIPKGEYGGGTVLLWDRGTWAPVGDARAMLAQGNLKFLLKGEKVKGKYALVKIRDRGAYRGRGEDGRNWLLIKERDAEARPESEVDITATRAESVATGRSMQQIAADPSQVWHSDRALVDAGAATGARAGVAAATPPRPRAAKLEKRSKPPEGPGWLHEMQIDGKRLLARATPGAAVELFDEAGKALPAAAARRHEAIANAVRLMPAQSLIVDGVATALFPDGRPRAEGLEEALAGEGPAALTFYVTDLLYLDGTDLSETPLEQRKALLAKLVARVRPPGVLRLSDHVAGDGAAFHREACRLGLPGMVSRRADGPTPPPRGAALLVRCAPPVKAKAGKPSTKKSAAKPRRATSRA